MISFKKEQIIIVTGASSGIGKCVAETLNALGATVVAIARREDKLKELKENAKFPENIHIEVKDLVEDIAGLPQYVKNLKEKYGKFSGLACCAGIGDLMSLQSISLEQAKRMFDINYFSTLFLVKGFADRRVNIGKGASIVAIASIAASIAEKGQVAYAGSKAAIVASMKAVSRELAPQGICVNTISPSMIKTPMLGDEDSDYYKEMLLKYPLGFGKANDAAQMIVFLLSDKTSWVTGQNYILDCGTY